MRSQTAKIVVLRQGAGIKSSLGSRKDSFHPESRVTHAGLYQYVCERLVCNR